MRSSDVLMVRVGQIAIFTGPAVTLAIAPDSNFDPINLIKLLILSTAAFAFLGLFLANFSFFVGRLGRPIILLASLFVFWLLVSFLMSDAYWSQQLWGVWGRSTGALTYFLLLLLMLSVASVQLLETYVRLVYGLVFVSVIEIAYMSLQTLDIDPVAWSRKEAFGTLGNINFSSAFIGIAMVALFALLVFGDLSFPKKMLILLVLSIDFLVIAKTGSIQGPIIFVIGSIFVTGFKIWVSAKSWRIPYIVLVLIAFFFSLAGLLNRGPLSSLLYQQTLVFRRDYWYAGFKMTTENPIFGLGMDSYGDYYRELRGLEATVRTGPDRIANSAHNIYLDVSSGGGIPLLILYLTFLGLGFFGAWRCARSTSTYSWHFVAVSGAWIAYHVQALVSINQIGVGVWGWILTGCLIGYGKLAGDLGNRGKFKNRAGSKESSLSSNHLGRISYKGARGVPMPVRSLLAMTIGAMLGVFVALPPLLADRNFKMAIQTREIEKMESALRNAGITAFHFEHVIQSAAVANLPDHARRLASELLSTYPRDYYGWQISFQLAQTDAERISFRDKLKKLDPHNPSL